jgi:DNA helicase-2/ATP-dependent DNA helicase PcrA
MPLDADATLADLTPAQRQAASIIDGAVLVLAGPGSGKTRVITRRIAYLVARGVPPWRILALTFTNKAAAEMRSRVDALLEGSVEARGAETGAARRRGLTVATFHSFCALLLRRYATEAGLEPGFSIYDTSDQRAVAKEAIEASAHDATIFTPAAALAVISRAKNQLVDAETFARDASDFSARAIAKIYRAYEAALRRNNAVDFDDLLFRTTTLLRERTDILRELQERYRYILVDEYQDTNHAQFVIAHALAAAHGNIFVVGDPDQSIYGWRGADIANILEFERHFPAASIVPLGENFRSTGHIVAAAAGLIARNTQRKHKELSTSLGAGAKPLVVRCPDEHAEAVRVAEFLLEASRENVPWRRMAVLYRMNALSRVVEDELRRRGVPYVIARGTAFWDRKEVRDVVAYLRTIANPSDDASLKRIVNVPPRGIGETTVRRLEAIALDAGVPLGDALVRADEFAATLGRSAAKVAAFGRTLASWRERAAALPPGALAEIVGDVLRESGLDAATSAYATEEELEAKRNRDEIVSAAAESALAAVDEEVEPPTSALEALRRFLDSIALVSDQDVVDADRGAVTLLTLHAAKGLEFEVVAMVGVERGVLPHARAEQEAFGVEEERRLCFVGMTRAERRLLLSSAAIRVVRGVPTPTAESEFLREIPAEHIEREAFESAGGCAGPRVEYDDEADSEAFVPMSRRYPIGCVVRHRMFGTGVVEQVVDRGRQSSVRVLFRSVGVKTLIPSVVPLERVDE